MMPKYEPLSFTAEELGIHLTQMQTNLRQQWDFGKSIQKK